MLGQGEKFSLRGYRFGEFRDNIGKKPNQIIKDVFLFMIIPIFDFF